MTASTIKHRFSPLVFLFPIALAAFIGASGASKPVDLDGNAANGAESLCELNVLGTFPVMIENKVTNRTGGDAYTFSWPSAGPGGFTSSITPGTAGGVGSKWTWTTNQSVFAFTGTTCATDACFTKTAGPDSITGFCSDACLADGTSLTVRKGATLGTYDLVWTGGTSTFTVFRGSTKIGVVAPANSVGTTNTFTFTDTPPADASAFYLVRGVDCTSYKACTTDSDCSGPSDGTCMNRGPFGVPGRSLVASDVTVSAASLTSSLITFFSPPKEVFRTTSTASAGGVAETVANFSTTPVTVTIPAYPAGCCPANPDVPHQLRCGDVCVDYLNDPNNCGGCGITCGDGTCCTNGSCQSLCAEGDAFCGGLCADILDDNNNCGGCGVGCPGGTCCNGAGCESLCPSGQIWCNEQCVDLANDSANCGTCGNACGDGTCCNAGSCASLCGEGRVWCNGQCVDLKDDSANCGACGAACGEGTCCNNGTCESFCPAGQLLCGEECVDPKNDNANCGACGAACGDGTCCSAGVCASLCAEGQVWCNGQCVDPRSDSANCGTCGHACGDGTCCNAGACESFCPAGEVLCGTQCVDPNSDNANCGACGHACGDGTCCSVGVCASLCGEGRVWCNGQCMDLQGDNDNCGVCGHACGEGTCCSGGTCASLCAAGQVWCNGQCVDLRNDSDNCGTCGHSCGAGTCCNASACASECPAGRTFCNGQCVDLQNDPHNCGSCGHSCRDDLHDDNECSHGVCEHDDLYNSLNDPPPIPAVCPNPTPTHPVAGYCPNASPAHPVAGYCPNPAPTNPTPGYCHNPSPTHPGPGYCPNSTPTTPTPAYCHNPSPSNPIPGVCSNPNPSSPTPGVCQNPHPSPGPTAGVCPEGGDASTVTETPNCQVEEHSVTIPPGGSQTTCNQGGVLFKEVQTAVTVCGDGVPGVDGLCNNTTTHVTTGTFNRLVPDPSKSVGNAYVTPYAVHVVSDTSNDGLLEPGESANLVIDLLNAGPVNITQASGTLSAPALDLTADGVYNPVGLTVGTASASYGTIPGTPVSTNCTAPPLQPVSNVTVFPITVPNTHPGDSSHPLNLTLTGKVNGNPFSMIVPISIGIADKCDPAANTRDFDGLNGLSSPMAKLAPQGDPVPFPSGSFNAGQTRPLKLRMSCGSSNLGDGAVDAPEIVGLSEATRGALDIHAINLNSDNGTNPNDPFFRYNNSFSGGQWTYSMRTSNIGTGTFTLTIRIAGRKNYVTGFVLN